MRTQSVILNLIPSGVNPVVHLSQYDQEDDGALLFNIYDGNVLADLTGCTATIEGTKPDGTFYMYPCTVYGTYLTCAVNFQMTCIAGSYPAEVRINRGAENVGTINLTVMVEPAGVGRVDVSDTEIPNLLDDIETSVDEAEYWAHVAEHAVTGVASWNGRTGAVNPAAGDYNASQVDYDNTNSGLTATDTQDAIDELADKAENKVLFFENVPCSAMTGNFVSISDAKITGDHVMTSFEPANPGAITTAQPTWTSGAGTFTINGTCSTATTATIILEKKDN